MNLQIENAVAVITGAASGIGKALAYQAAAAGMQLALADVDGDSLAQVTAELEWSRSRPLAVILDVRSADDTEAFAQEVFKWATTPVALVFANAGVHAPTPAARPDLDLWNRAIDVNLRGTVHMIHAFLGRMIDRGEPAQFVITGSQGSFIAAPGASPYTATKHALWGLADTLRLELERDRAPVGISFAAPGRTVSAITLRQQEHLRATEGEAAARAYGETLATPEVVADILFREAVKRAFWIIPNDQPVLPLVQDRMDRLAAALPAGRIDPSQ